jgi:hypothetical protein
MTEIKAPQRGHMNLWEACKPPLLAGDYQVESFQHLMYEWNIMSDETRPIDEDHRQHPFPTQTFQQSFRVAGPRFQLMPSDIHGVYPPPNSVGLYTTRLPQVTLRRRTLPWERRLNPQDTTNSTPWLALLILRDDEIVDIRNPSTGNTVGAMMNGNADGTLGHHLTLTTAEHNQPCYGVEMTLATFQAVAPTAKEVRLLTHVRQVNTEDKELLGMDKDGWFSVVVGNRLPVEDTRYTVFLISLEGLASYLPTYDTPSTSAQTPLRCIALAYWTFTCADDAEDFGGLMRNIVERDQVSLLGAVPLRETGDDSYRVTLDSGHIPMRHTARSGEKSVVWYRGPAVAAHVTRNLQSPYHNADQARRIDPHTGLENISYASAFEIGRLLAIKHPTFASALFQWRRDVAKTHHRNQRDASLPPNIRPLGDKRSADQIRSMLENMRQVQLPPLYVDDWDKFFEQSHWLKRDFIAEVLGISLSQLDDLLRGNPVMLDVLPGASLAAEIDFTATFNNMDGVTLAKDAQFISDLQEQIDNVWTPEDLT